MKLTDLFIRRPVLAIVVNLVIIIAGLQAIRSLNVRQYPKLESATITVTTVYVGASADLVRGFITTPLERSIAAADGIDYIESQSVQGLSTINVRLKLNFNAAAALADISARVDQVRADLPPEAQIPAITIEPPEGSSTVVSARRTLRPGIVSRSVLMAFSGVVSLTSLVMRMLMRPSLITTGVKPRPTPKGLNSMVVLSLSWATGIGNSPPARNLAFSPEMAVSVGSARVRIRPSRS